RVPVAYLDRGDADRHGVLFMDASSLRQYAPYCVNLHQPWKGAPEIAGPAASVDRAAFDTHGYTVWTEIPKGSSLLPYLGVLSFGWPGSANPDSERFRSTPRTCGRFLDILSLR